MADLNSNQAAMTTKIIGSDSTGLETTPVKSDLNGNLNVVDFATSATGSAAPSSASFIGAKNPSNALVGLLADAVGNLKVTDVLSTGGLQAALTVGTTAVEVRVGASKLANRRLVTVMPQDDMFWGWTSGVTTATGTPIFKNQLVTFEVNDTVTIYLIASTAAKSARITECA